MPGIDVEDILEKVFPGPDLEPVTQPPNFPSVAQPTWKEGQAVAVYKEVIDGICMQKFLGPFPEWVTQFRVHLTSGETIVLNLNTLPMFVIEKGDSTPKLPKFRVLLNAS